jgi:hypothetical protein
VFVFAAEPHAGLSPAANWYDKIEALVDMLTGLQLNANTPQEEAR